MKFIYDGDYKTVDGVTFMFRNPTTVENKTTIEKLMKDPQFKRYHEETTQVITLPDICPKCGRLVKQGKVMHQRFCKGPA